MILQPAAETKSILSLSTIYGFRANNRGLRTFVLGDDISIRINAVIAALQTAGVFYPPTAGQKLALEKIFYQLCNLSRAPITLVFVFDGSGRPSIKRGTRVIARPLWLIEHLKKMITSFGFYFYDAPGEAEAELAQLNAEGRIDGILTEDSDAFVFGARLVIRTLGPSVEHNSILYSADSIENTDAVSLDREGLLLCILLLGGEYDAGVPGVGPKIARALALLGFGHDLVNILDNFTGGQLNWQIIVWRNRLREELRTNARGRLGQRQPRLAERIPDSFPSLRVADLYLNPVTSASPQHIGPMPGFNSWRPQEPNIFGLSSLCSFLFGGNG
ncbi:PIN domain-like protein [Mycena metata]|uniref:PIN domain-like protein n=1 Tax=Mycena metata TaxID=1033252 RepID=A0AAD7HZV8_9AGAR|nr:PIN domain-like protein [Mycena metata]